MSDSEHRYETRTGLELDEFYGPRVADAHYTENIGDPGQFPYTRGTKPEGYRDAHWVMGMYSGFGTAEEANQRFKYLLDHGQTGFSIALDMPTQIGLDSDHALARPEVGRVGVAIDTLDDIHRLFDGIDLSKVRQFRTSANAIGPIIAAMFVAFAEESGISPTSFRVLFQNDSLKEYPARGTWIFPLSAGRKLSCDVIEYCTRELPGWNAIQFCGAHYREAGATVVQELAFALADAIAYIEEVLSRGLHVDEFAETFYYQPLLQTDFLEEVAMLRAARRYWSRLLRDRFGSQDPEVMKLKIFAACGGSSLTTQQPLNNVVRVAIQALAGACGGVQTMSTASYDEGYGIPTEESSALALRTQQLVAYESGVAESTDPLGGSYLIEALTDKIEAGVAEELARIEELGGALGAIEAGYMQDALAESAYHWHRDLESGQKIMVGVNKLREEEAENVVVFPASDGSAETQIAYLNEARRKRDDRVVQECLSHLRSVATAGGNTIPALIPTVKARASLGEICSALADVYGSYQQRNAV